MAQKLGVFSFFSGAGFLDLGFEKSDFDVLFANENHPPFLEAYKSTISFFQNRTPPYGFYEGDICNLVNGGEKNQIGSFFADAQKNYDVIGFIGGPPCPDFSIGGKNKGIKGDNGKLSAVYCEIIRKNKPHFFLFENVKGLWKTKKHRLFYDKIKKDLQGSGYFTTEKLVNSIEYGVPQDRERIFLIGFRKDIFDNSYFKEKNGNFIPENLFPWKKQVRFKKEEIFSLPWPKKDPFQEDSLLLFPEGIVEELTVEFWFKKNGTENHPNSSRYFKPRAGIVRMKSVEEGDVSKKSYKRLHRWRYSPTACYGNNEVHLHPYKARRISVAEALAIQSIPREFVLPNEMTLSDSFKAIGNGVPFLVAKGVANTIKDYILGGFGEFKSGTTGKGD